MSPSKIAVVTGAAGFIGSHMVDLLLEEGYEVRALDNLSSGRLENLEHHSNNPKLIFENRDVRTLPEKSALFQGAAFVFHFAGMGDIVPSIDQPVEYLSVNLMGTVKALEAARHAGVKKFVYAASSSRYSATAAVP